MFCSPNWTSPQDSPHSTSYVPPPVSCSWSTVPMPPAMDPWGWHYGTSIVGTGCASSSLTAMDASFPAWRTQKKNDHQLVGDWEDDFFFRKIWKFGTVLVGPELHFKIWSFNQGLVGASPFGSRSGVTQHSKLPALTKTHTLMIEIQRS